MSELTKYTKSKSTDFGGLFNSDNFKDEICESSIVVALDRIDVVSDVIDVWFKDILSSEDEITLNELPNTHKSNPLIEVDNVMITGSITAIPTFEDTEGLNPQWTGYLYTAASGSISIFDEPITTELRIRGGWYEIFTSTSVIGDYMEFSIVDKDNILGAFVYYGLDPTNPSHFLELKKYVRKDYICPGLTGNREIFAVGGAFTVAPGLYFRTTYNSLGTEDVTFKTVIFAYE